MDRVLTKEAWLEIFGSLTWSNGCGFELVFEPDESGTKGTVWLQTAGAEEDRRHGVSCMLPNVWLWHDGDDLKKFLSSDLSGH